MDEIWEKAVETALAGEKEPAATRVLTLDGAVKCLQGHLPRPELLEKFQNLEHLSIASIGVSSLEQFPRLGKLQKLVLSDNRISGGLEFLVQAGLGSLRDLDLSNNRIHFIEDLVPLADLKLVSLDLYECPVTKIKDYRSKVFGLVKSLKYLDKMDAEENERPESEDEDEDDEEEEEEEDDEEEEEDEEDPGSCEIDGEEKPKLNGMMSNGHSERLEEVLEVDEEESEADEEETETRRQTNGVSDHHANGFRDENLNMDGEESDDSDEEDAYEEDGPLIGASRDSDEEDEDEDEAHVYNDAEHPREIFGDLNELRRPSNGVSDHVLLNLDEDDSDGEDEYEDDGLLVPDTEDMDEEDEYEDDGLIVVEDDDDDEEEVGNDDGPLILPHRDELLRNIIIEEIDGHEQGEDDGESGEEDDDQGVDDGEEEEDEDFVARPLAEAIEVNDEVEGEEEYSDDDEGHVVCPIASSHLKRKRDDDDDANSVSDSSDNKEDDDGSSDDGDDDEQ